MERVQWEITVPAWRDRFFIKGILLALGIPSGCLAVLLTLMFTGRVADADFPYVLGLIGMLYVLTILLVAAMYGGRYAPGFIIDKEGIMNYGRAKPFRKNRISGVILTVRRFFQGSGRLSGAAMPADSRQVARILWKSVTRVKYYPKQKTILVLGNFAEKIVIFCTKDNYSEVEKIIRDHFLTD